MAGNSARRGATRKPGSKKGATVGTGGQRGKQLQGRGPTPPAEARTGHPAARRSAAAKKRSGRSGGGRGTYSRTKAKDSSELVVGRNSVLEALRANVPATTLYVAARIDADDRVREVLKVATGRGVALLEAPRPELDRMTGGAVHQGLVLQVPLYDYAHPEDLLAAARDAGAVPLLVALDGVTDPRNLGAVVRSTAAFGGDGVIVTERRSAGMTAGAWKAAAGAASRVRVARATNLTRTLQTLRDQGCVVVGLAADGEVPVRDLEAAVDPLVVVVGSEGRGLSRLVSEACDFLVSIPMHEPAESLNASVAAAIVLHEVAERRRRG